MRFQEVWRRVRSEFSHEFVQFCERALNVNPPSVLVLRSGTPSYVSRWDEMRREFGQEFLSYFVAMPPVMGFRHTRNPSGYLGEIAGQFASNYWLIGYGEPTEQDGVVSDTARIQNIVGFVAVFDPILTNGTPTDASEFLLWVRGAYRMAGVGAVAMRLLFTEGAAPPLKGKKLFARFPKIGTGFAEQLQRAMWVQFMNDFDFYGVPPTGAAWEQRELRVQYLPERAG